MTRTLELSIFVFEHGGCWPCFEKRQQLSRHCHQHHYWDLKTWVSARPSVQTLATLHQTWTMSCASCWVCSPGPSDHLPCTVPSAYRSGTWIFAISDSFTLLLKKTSFLWTSVIQEAFSHHDVAFTSTPVLFHPDSAQPFIVKSDCLSQVAEAILSQRRPSLFLECAFHFFS